MSRYGLIHIRHGRGEKKRVQTLSTMRSSNIQHWYDIHDETPFFVPDEAHEENKADRRKDERSDLGVASETEWGEHRSDHDETWEEGREVSPEWRYLQGTSQKRDDVPITKGTDAPFGALAFVDVKIDAGKLGP
jgi:uncharacterized protein YbaR (Trm112 family)